MQEYRETRFSGEALKVSSRGDVGRAALGSGQSLSYVEQLEQRIAQLEKFVAQMDAIAERRIKDQNAWAKQIIEASDHETRCFNNHLDETEKFVKEFYAWKHQIQERLETADALVHDVASHLFPMMKHFVDDVNEVCAKPQPPVKPAK